MFFLQSFKQVLVRIVTIILLNGIVEVIDTATMSIRLGVWVSDLKLFLSRLNFWIDFKDLLFPLFFFFFFFFFLAREHRPRSGYLFHSCFSFLFFTLIHLPIILLIFLLVSCIASFFLRASPVTFVHPFLKNSLGSWLSSFCFPFLPPPTPLFYHFYPFTPLPTWMRTHARTLTNTHTNIHTHIHTHTHTHAHHDTHAEPRTRHPRMTTHGHAPTFISPWQMVVRPREIQMDEMEKTIFLSRAGKQDRIHGTRCA